MLLFIACAQEGAPPGGPPDRHPPIVVITEPATGSTDIPPAISPEITFNERMDTRSLEESIFIAPLASFRLKTNWGGDAITLVFDEPLAPAQTYVITIGTGARDVRGNRMASSMVLAFSTGPTLDTGEITGTVASAGGDVVGAYVWAYNLQRRPAPHPSHVLPDYIIQAGQGGRFAFSNLSPGTYRLFAFLDRGRDGRYDAGLDLLGVPTGDVLLTEDRPIVENRRLTLAATDTTALTLLSVRTENASHLRLRFSRPIGPETVKDTSLYRIRNEINGSTLPVQAAYLAPDDSLSVALITALQTPGVRYTIAVTALLDREGQPIDPAGAGGAFSGAEEPDRRPPTLLRSIPADSARHAPLSTAPTLVFNEATRIDDGAISLTDESNRPVDGAIIQENPALAWFQPDSTLSANTRYRLCLMASGIRDWNGNALAVQNTGQDTLVISFTTVDPAIYGMITGRISDADTTGIGAIHITLAGVDTIASRYDTIIPSPGDYRFGEVLPGRYTVSAFRDADSNGRLNPGAILPFRPAERTTAHPDTVEVRSGWESEQVDILFPP